MSESAEILRQRTVATARMLTLDAIERAKSGHPGAATALAPAAELLFRAHIRHDPSDPQWIGRDRFVLSGGHASMMLYSQLHLTGYDVSLDDLRAFRTVGSRTPGHPEFGETPGVDVTTGPLGQGIATAVGIAMAFKWQRGTYDAAAAAGSSPFDRRVWVMLGDGDLQEGVSYEACSLAGRHRLDNLIAIYDHNSIQIDGGTDLAWDEDVRARFEAQGWEVIAVDRAADGDIDVAGLDAALTALTAAGRPHLVVLRSEIAWPAPNARGTAASHGAPLGADEVEAIRLAIAPGSQPFEVPDDVLAFSRRAVDRGRELHDQWDRQMADWRQTAGELADQWDAGLAAAPAVDPDLLPAFETGTMVSTRDASGAAIQELARQIPTLLGGSADLSEPNRTEVKEARAFMPDGAGAPGRNIHWGVREHAMAAAMNGIALAGGNRVFGGTFLVFSDYQRPAIRLAALMGLPVTYVWSHDSVAVGQDGPTHQPIEHLASLRAMPGFTMQRPADARETVAAWMVAIENDGPTGIALGRQPVPVLPVDPISVYEGVRRGGYIVSDDQAAEITVIGTGSEVELALEAAGRLRDEGHRVRVVSMPCRERFLAQDAAYRSAVLPPRGTPMVAVEAASTFGWRDIVGDRGEVVGIDRFGASGPAGDVQVEVGLTAEAVVDAAHRLLSTPPRFGGGLDS